MDDKELTWLTGEELKALVLRPDRSIPAPLADRVLEEKVALRARVAELEAETQVSVIDMKEALRDLRHAMAERTPHNAEHQRLMNATPGEIVAHVLAQIAALEAENARLRETLSKVVPPDLARQLRNELGEDYD